MYAWCNVASLLLGLLAWFLPLQACFRGGQPISYGWCAAGSSAACALSLLFQLVYADHLVSIDDWSALADTSYAVTGAAVVLVISTFLLNTLAVLISRRTAR